MKASFPSITRGLLLVGLVVLHFTLAPSAQAAVTGVAWYRLGETDPGASSGAAVTNSTADIAGTKHLTPAGSPTYTAAVSAAASNRLDSVRGVQFTGAANQWLSNPSVSSANNNFGYEAWIRVDNTNTNLRAVINNGFAGSIGWGLIQQNDLVAGYLGTDLTYGVQIPAVGVWAHVAVVTDNGTATIYLNGQDSGGLPVTTSSGSSGVGPFTLGGASGLAGFVGSIDEVRVFTFAPGQFSTNDLLLNLQRVVTLPATNATLNGSVNPVGLPASAWFEWGTTTNYGNVTPAQPVGSGAAGANFSQTLSNLFGGLAYHFRAVGSNTQGVAYGANQSFSLPVFNDIGVGLPGVDVGSAAWVDYDNDGRLDILLAGRSQNTNNISQVWRNTGNGFTNINAGLPGVWYGSAAWGDCDNDGRLDILLTGTTNDFWSGSTANIWRNSGSGFTNINAGLPGIGRGSAAWGDCDNDGRLDILSVGTSSGTESKTQILRNTDTGFVLNLSAQLPGVDYSSAAWGDYDNDGRLDILLTGTTNGNSLGNVSQVWRNTGNGFTNINAGLPRVYYSSAAWGDYDNDGRLDILLTGTTNGNASGALSQVWRNTGNGFTNIKAGLPGVWYGSAAWGDCDNDGRLDILLTGTTNGFSSGKLSQVWRNTGNGFTNINAGLPAVFRSSAAWGDYDNDGRLDILLTGVTNEVGDIFFGITSRDVISQVWRNNTPISNTPPNAPTGLSVTAAGTMVRFTWNAASDMQTAASGLGYNLRVGTTPGGANLVNPMSATSGLRRLPGLGNAQMANARSVALPAGQPLYWSVQAVDPAFAGSAFAPEQSFTFNSVLTPPNGVPVPGDANGDGIVSETELSAVLASYFPTSPWLQMTNVAGLGGTNVTFGVSNAVAGSFSVEYTTNLVDWQFLGPALPRYLFTDTNAPAVPQRFYRLSWP